MFCLKEVVRSVKTMLNKAEVINLNPPLLSCANMSKKKKKHVLTR
jgi:hypothetical protein